MQGVVGVGGNHTCRKQLKQNSPRIEIWLLHEATTLFTCTKQLDAQNSIFNWENVMKLVLSFLSIAILSFSVGSVFAAPPTFFQETIPEAEMGVIL